MEMRTTIYHAIIVNIRNFHIAFHDSIVNTMSLVYGNSYEFIVVPHMSWIVRNFFNNIQYFFRVYAN